MFRTIEQLLPAVDCVHLQCAYDTEYITITKPALKAMAKRVTSYALALSETNYGVRDSPISFSDVMRTCSSDLKRPDFLYFWPP